MSEALLLEIVTPTGVALRQQVSEMTAPSVAGEFGVLPGHLPLLAALRTGIVTYRQGAETKRVAVGAGFAEAGPDRLILLTDEYAERESIDPVVVRKDLAAVQRDLQKLESVPVVASDAKADDAAGSEARARRAALIARQNWLAVQLELYGDPPPATMRLHEEYGPPGLASDDELPESGNGSPRP